MSVNRLSLEEQFASYVLSEVNIHQECEFDFLAPNELFPHLAKPHMDLAEKGVCVSTGTVRNLFYIANVNVDKCEGFVIRDCSHRVKAFLDLKLCLIRISANHEEYVELNRPIFWKKDEETNSQLLKDRIEEITQKIKNGNLRETMKLYYLKNVCNFAKVYFETPQNWKHDRCFKECNYETNPYLFNKVQTFAMSGNIIVTIGDINDLSFLDSRKVSLIDTSNISDYVPINPKVEGNPRIIRVTMDHKYSSHIYTLLTEAQRAEFDALLVKFENKDRALKIAQLLSNNKPSDVSPFDDHYWLSYSPTTLSLLKSLVPCLQTGTKRSFSDLHY